VLGWLGEEATKCFNGKRVLNLEAVVKSPCPTAMEQFEQSVQAGKA
jgi:hypothetical protein